MPSTPTLDADFSWACPACHRLYGQPQRAAQCPCPSQKTLAIVAPLVRCTELPMWDGHPVALTSWLEADQAELTVLHRRPNGNFKTTRHRFCASRTGLEPTGQYALVAAAQTGPIAPRDHFEACFGVRPSTPSGTPESA